MIETQTSLMNETLDNPEQKPILEPTVTSVEPAVTTVEPVETEELVEEIIEPVETVEPVEEEEEPELVKPTPKPKKKRKPPTEKQLEQLAKARLTRAENQRKKNELKGKPTQPTAIGEEIPKPTKALAKKKVVKPNEEVKEQEPKDYDIPKIIELDDIEEEPVKKSRKKIVKVVKRKRQVKPPKEIIYMDSDSETDDDELLGEVYKIYKEQLQKKKKRQAHQEPINKSHNHPKFNLRFI